MISDTDSQRLRNYIRGAGAPTMPTPAAESLPPLYELYNMTRAEALARGLDVYALWKQHGCFLPEYATPPSTEHHQ